MALVGSFHAAAFVELETFFPNTCVDYSKKPVFGNVFHTDLWRKSGSDLSPLSGNCCTAGRVKESPA